MKTKLRISIFTCVLPVVVGVVVTSGVAPTYAGDSPGSSSTAAFVSASPPQFPAILPVPSPSPSPSPVAFCQELGVPDGVRVTGVSYGLSITDTIRPEPPSETSHAIVRPLDVTYRSCEIGTALTYATPVGSFTGGQAADKKKHALGPKKGQVLPNQANQGGHECVPTAISDSLQWLNERFDLGLKADQVSIATMKTATG